MVVITSSCKRTDDGDNSAYCAGNEKSLVKVWKVFGTTENDQLTSLFAPPPDWRALYQKDNVTECGPRNTPMFAFDTLYAAMCFCANGFKQVAPDIHHVEIWECLAHHLPDPALVPLLELSWLWEPFWRFHSLHPSSDRKSLWGQLRERYGSRMGMGCAALETPWGTVACRELMPVQMREARPLSRPL